MAGKAYDLTFNFFFPLGLKESYTGNNELQLINDYFWRPLWYHKVVYQFFCPYSHIPFSFKHLSWNGENPFVSEKDKQYKILRSYQSIFKLYEQFDT